MSLAVALARGGEAAPAGATQVAASIKPIHSLVAGVMEGVGEPELLLEGRGSPHGTTLQPSKARALSQAEVVFWVGPGLETFLAKPLQALAEDATVVALAGLPGVTRLPVRAPEAWGGGTGDEAAHDAIEAEHAHAPGQTDPHVWLDPRNAQAMVNAIAHSLKEADPEHAPAYERNAARLRDQIEQLDQELERQLAPLRDRPFIVFHDAYRYLEERYGLRAAGAITLGPERHPGAQHLRRIRDTLEELDVACVFAEPQFEPALVRMLLEGTGARLGVLDPLGADIAAGPGHYALLLRQLAESLDGCLGGARTR